MSKYHPDDDTFIDAQGYKFSERDCCQHCRDEAEAQGKPFAFAEVRSSFGIYAGRYCDQCWPKSGYRDATDPDAEFDPLDAGECLEAEDY
jgi:hypothetical protein